MIRLAEEKDIKAIESTYISLLTHEEEVGGFSNWKLGIYPTISVPEQKIPLQEMYVLEEDDEICASMVLNKDQADEYLNVPWQYSAAKENVLVIHTLCIPPNKAGHGYGSRMIKYAKEFAIRNGCSVIRLDTYAHNEPAKNLYLKNGFRIAGHGECYLQGLIFEEQVYLECNLNE